MSEEELYQLGIKILILSGKNKVILLRAIGSDFGENYWDLPGGRIRRGEDAISALNREINEELRIDLQNVSFQFIGVKFTNVRIPIREKDSKLMFMVFTCKLENEPEVILSTEHKKYLWASYDDAKSKLATIGFKPFIEILYNNYSSKRKIDVKSKRRIDKKKNKSKDDKIVNFLLGDNY